MAEPLGADRWRDITITSRDGLSLYGRHYQAVKAEHRPVLCLAGLTRNSRDFHNLATALSTSASAPRDVYTFDCRGRGQSDHARSWKDYAVPIEMFDVQDFMTSQQLHDTAVIGTSRGGLIAMVMAAAQPSLIGAAVLNDIGPVIEYAGLARISGYVGKDPTPRSWDEAVRLVRNANAEFFPAVKDDAWHEIAQQWYNESDGKPVAGYDPNLGRSFALRDGAVPELWPQFLALKRVPCLVLRGENSDLLSPKTVEEMQRRHPNCLTYTVENEGHAPLLRDTHSIGAIHEFLQKAD
ncbi:MAG: alpha/beta fold hydrolase [Hyphomicrobiaceae bacterium]